MSVSGSSPQRRCFVHCSGVIEDLKPFTEKRWSKVLNSVQIWKDLVGFPADIARDFVQEFGSAALGLAAELAAEWLPTAMAIV